VKDEPALLDLALALLGVMSMADADAGVESDLAAALVSALSSASVLFPFFAPAPSF